MERVEEVPVRLPIFVLSAPVVPGCIVKFGTETTTSTDIDCTLNIRGTGLSGGCTMTSKATCEFTAGEGVIKAAFVPAKVTVAEVSVLRDNRVLHKGLQIDAAEMVVTGKPAVTVATRRAGTTTPCVRCRRGRASCGTACPEALIPPKTLCALEPRVGIEPTTYALPRRCSTSELSGPARGDRRL